MNFRPTCAISRRSGQRVPSQKAPSQRPPALVFTGAWPRSSEEGLERRGPGQDWQCGLPMGNAMVCLCAEANSQRGQGTAGATKMPLKGHSFQPSPHPRGHSCLGQPASHKPTGRVSPRPPSLSLTNLRLLCWAQLRV